MSPPSKLPRRNRSLRWCASKTSTTSPTVGMTRSSIRLPNGELVMSPFFPLGGFTPLQSETLSNVAARLNVKPMSLALAWLLQRSPNILLIPGTSSVEHLRENVAGAGLQLPYEAIKELNHAALRQSNSRAHS